MIKKFSEWVKFKEGASYLNPTIQRPDSDFNGRPNMEAITRHIQQMMKTSPGHDPVTGMNNIAANASNHNMPQMVNDTKPLNWDLIHMLRQWGFGNQDQFYQWWSRGGRDQVAKIRDQLTPPNPSNYVPGSAAGGALGSSFQNGH